MPECNNGAIEGGGARTLELHPAIVTPRPRQRNARSIITGILLTVVIISTTLYLSYKISVLVPDIDLCVGPLNPPYKHKDWSDLKNQSFSVGFDLTASYGTAAIEFENGTIVNVVQIKGSEEYMKLLWALSGPVDPDFIVPPTPPYYDCDAQFVDLGRQWKRYFRKKTGHPASSRVETLVTVLEKLKSATDSVLGDLGPFDKAFITVPDFPAFFLEDLVDAGEYLGVQLLTLPWYIHRPGDQAQWPVSELNTAFAGNGLGFRHQSSQNRSIPLPKEVLSVLFTNTALSTHVLPLYSALGYYTSHGYTEFDLGLRFASPSDENCTSSYWHGVRRQIFVTLTSYYRYNYEDFFLDYVVSYGEAAHDSRFDRVLREEVLAFQKRNGEPKKLPVFSSVEPIFAAARGAALFGGYCKKLERPGDCIPDLRPRLPGW